MTRHRFPLIVPFLFFLAAIGAPAGAQIIEVVGTRAQGMGGAFVAVADDGSATYWNPAGLATGGFLDIGLARAVFDQGGRASGPGGAPEALAGTGTGFWLAGPPIGLSYNRLRFDFAGGAAGSTGTAPPDRQDLRLRGVDVSSLVTGQYGLTLLQSVSPGVIVGATFKLVRGTAAVGQGTPGATGEDLLEEAAGLAGRTTTAADIDLGVMVGGGPLRVGLVVRNLREPSFEAPSGERLALRRQARVGLALTPGRAAMQNAADAHGLILAADFDLTRNRTPAGERRHVAVGAERWWAGRRIGLRAGARASTVGAARPVASAGVSVGVSRGIFLEAAGTRGHREGDRGWSAGIRAGF